MGRCRNDDGQRPVSGSYYNDSMGITQHNGSSPANFQVIDNELHFSATDANGTALWKTDGTTIGTVKVLDLPHFLPYLNDELIKLGSALYYPVQDALGAELHRVELNGSSVSDLWASAMIWATIGRAFHGSGPIT